MLLLESAWPLLVLHLITFSSPLIGCHALLKRKLPSPQVRGSNMANKESTCEGGDVRWCAPEKKIMDNLESFIKTNPQLRNCHCHINYSSTLDSFGKQWTLVSVRINFYDDHSSIVDEMISHTEKCYLCRARLHLLDFQAKVILK